MALDLFRELCRIELKIVACEEKDDAPEPIQPGAGTILNESLLRGRERRDCRAGHVQNRSRCTLG